MQRFQHLYTHYDRHVYFFSEFSFASICMLMAAHQYEQTRRASSNNVRPHLRISPIKAADTGCIIGYKRPHYYSTLSSSRTTRKRTSVKLERQRHERLQKNVDSFVTNIYKRLSSSNVPAKEWTKILLESTPEEDDDAFNYRGFSVDNFDLGCEPSINDDDREINLSSCDESDENSWEDEENQAGESPTDEQPIAVLVNKVLGRPSAPHREGPSSYTQRRKKAVSRWDAFVAYLTGDIAFSRGAQSPCSECTKISKQICSISFEGRYYRILLLIDRLSST
jgi:hypothetical protein